MWWCTVLIRWQYIGGSRWHWFCLGAKTTCPCYRSLPLISPHTPMEVNGKPKRKTFGQDGQKMFNVRITDSEGFVDWFLYFLMDGGIPEFRQPVNNIFQRVLLTRPLLLVVISLIPKWITVSQWFCGSSFCGKIQKNQWVNELFVAVIT